MERGSEEAKRTNRVNAQGLANRSVSLNDMAIYKGETNMKKKDKAQDRVKRVQKRQEKKKRPSYEEPKVITYSGDELLKELGPAQACRAFGCPVAP